METWINARIAKGFNVVVFTLQDNTVTSGAFRNALNALITSNAATVCDDTSCSAGAGAINFTVANLGADSNMGCNGCSGDATYFRDGVHPTVAGNGVYATYLKVALSHYGLQ
jgi:hypothetical protein